MQFVWFIISPVEQLIAAKNFNNLNAILTTISATHNSLFYLFEKIYYCFTLPALIIKPLGKSLRKFG